MQKEKDYLDLLKIFVQVVEANKGVAAGEDDRILDAEGLALKFFCHASTVLYLYQGTVLPGLGANFIDSVSINVLGRAALETFLVFHYVFVAPKSETEKDFRYMCWLLAGLTERQTFPVQSPKGKKMLSKEKKSISPLQAKLEANGCFKALTQKQQNNLVERVNGGYNHGKRLGFPLD